MLAISRERRSDAAERLVERRGRLDQRPTRLPRTARPGKRRQTRARSHGCNNITRFRLRPTNQLAGFGRFVFEMVFSGGKRSAPSWNNLRRFDEVFQAMLAEVGYIGLDQRARFFREQYLTARAPLP